jgi:tetratricopeptide (TPR) repeat protein
MRVESPLLSRPCVPSASGDIPKERAIGIRVLVLIGTLVLGVSRAADPQVTSWETHVTAGAKAYQEGRYAEAEKSWVAAAKEAEAFGPEDPRLATSLNNLALLYHARGRYAEAEPLYRRALAIWEKAQGSDHPDVATAVNNLAELYLARGRYVDAEPLLRRALALREKALGPDHPDVAQSLNNLAALSTPKAGTLTLSPSTSGR